MKRVLFITLAVVVGAIGVFAYRIVTRSGMLKKISPHVSGTCRAVMGVVGAEDVTIDPDTMVAYLSADDRRAAAAGNPKRGEVYALDVVRQDATPLPLTRGVPADFHPHGLSLWRGPNGGKRLFVINHPEGGGHTVEIYDVVADGLAHAETVRYAELSSPNDLVAVGPRQFYASNDRGYRDPGVMATLESYLQLPLASVSYFDGTGGRIVARRLVAANGANASADGKTVYVGELLGQSVHVYDRDPVSGDLAERDVIEVDSCPDNIEVDEAGTLWVAAHAKVFDLLAHSTDASKPAPSQVLRIDPATRSVVEVYLDDGSTLSSASTASVAGDHMLLGAIFEPKVLVCDRP